MLAFFQGNSLFPLLFVLSLFPLSSILNDLHKGFVVDGIVISHLLYLDDLKLYSELEQDMLIQLESFQMTFGFSKCATLVVKHGKVADCTDTELPEGTIEALPISSVYIYLGALEAREFQHKEVKSRVITTYKQ